MNLPQKHRPLIIGLAIAALVLVVGAIVYVAEGHPKHALLLGAIAIACGIALWFATGSEAQNRT
jgi:hypothetical protein